MGVQKSKALKMEKEGLLPEEKPFKLTNSSSVRNVL
jgi:hypothetical protein